MRGIVKQFPGARALDGVDLEIRAGEVHCLLGQNGAGKSTLIKVLAGAHQPDEGEILIDGQPVTISHPVAGLKLGIATMYQELDVVDGLSVAENIYLGHELAVAGFSQRRAATASTRAILERLGHGDISPHREVGRLSAAGKQIVSMARALSHDARVIVMDEPSAVLDSEEVENLFRVVRELTSSRRRDRLHLAPPRRDPADRRPDHRAQGRPDRRDGPRRREHPDGRPDPADDRPRRRVRDPAAAAGRRRRADAAARRRPGPARARSATSPSTSAPARSSASPGWSAPAARRSSRRSSALAAGPRAPSRSGPRRCAPAPVSAAVKAGIGLCPEERKSQGLILDEPVYRNITLSTFARTANASFLDEGSERRAAKEQIDALDVRPSDPDRAARTLSGGNQQKVLLARWLVHGCRVLLLDEPTRGVDVGARAEIYALIADLAKNGAAVVVVSSEIAEVIGLSDRILVVSEGRVVHDGPASSIDEHRVLDLVMEGSAA